ncbi:MAG TPA: S41 family peptidase [Gemmatimonadales bacterium]
MTVASRVLALALGLATLTHATTRDAAAQASDGAQGPLRKRTVYEDLQMFSQALNQIRVNHPDSVDTHELFMAAVEGMVRAADPHSYVIPAVRLDTLKERQLRDGKLHPVPVAFRYVGGTPVVVSVAPGSEAARQDILPGDALVSIDGQPVRAESPMELEVTLAGPRHSRVTLGLERRRMDGTLARLERPLRRERVEEGTAVPAAFMIDQSTGYVRITTFAAEKVADDLRDVVRRLEDAGMTQLLLDLRDNGGGRVDQAARIAGEFLPRGAVVYTMEGRKEEVTDTGRVSRSFWRSERRYPVVLLVNEGTASASELLAGALQDHDRALVVGRPTFGKALVMRGFPMTDGSVIVLVVGQARTPCGRAIQRKYRDVSSRDYYRLAAAERDTVGRPACRTTGGRVVYGGGGIYPDVLLDEPAGPPHWLARLRELNVALEWVGGWVTANEGLVPTVEGLAASPTLPAAALTSFRAFAAEKGVGIPADVDAELQRHLVSAVAYARFGDAGLYRVTAVTDPAVARAREELGRAEALTPPQRD